MFCRNLLWALALLFFMQLSGQASEVSGQRMAWAHYTPWHMPLNASISAYTHYNYPLFRSLGTEQADWAEEFRQAKEQGVDGFFVDIPFREKGRPAYHDFFARMLRAAEGSDFQVGICLDVKTNVETQVRELSRMLDDVGEHPNYPHYNGRPIVATFTWMKWTPEEWADIRAGLQSAGHNPYLIANFDPGYSRLTADSIKPYLPHFDMAHSFGLAGLNGMPRQELADLIADTSIAHGKEYMATLFPGYYGAWLNGRNDYYQPHRGFDQFHDSFLAVRPQRDNWLHFSTWNDHDETSVLPMLFTTANPLITKAYTDSFKGALPVSRVPEVCFAYHREEIPGTLLRIEALSLPTLASGNVTVSGELLDQAGRAVVRLEPRQMNVREFDRTEWLIPTVNLAYTPTLTPRIRIAGANFTHTTNLPPVFLVNGWLQNAVTVKVAANEYGDLKNSLTVSTDEGSESVLNFEIAYDPAYSVSEAQNEDTDHVTGITLFRNDRPLAVFNSKTENKTLLNLYFTGTADWSIKIENGEILNAVRKFAEKTSSAFVWNHESVRSSGVLSWFPAGVLCSVSADTRLILSVRGHETITLTPFELLKTGGVSFEKFHLEVAPVDVTVQNHDFIENSIGNHRLSVLLAKAPQPADMFYARYETKGGKVALSPIVYPFATAGKTIPANLIETAVNLETSSGATGMPGENEYLTGRNRLPVKESSVVAAQIPLESIRFGQWTFDRGGYDSLGERDIRIPEGMLVADESGAGHVLKLDGTQPLKMRLRTWPMGNTTVEFRINPDPGVGKPQMVIGRTGWSDGININLRTNGRIEVVRDGNNDVPRETLVSKTPIAFGEWTRVRVTNDSLKLRIYLDDRLDSEMPIKPARSYGNSTWFVGGGHEAASKSGYVNYQGRIDALSVAGAVFDPDVYAFPIYPKP